MEIQSETIKILFKSLYEHSQMLANLSAENYALQAVLLALHPEWKPALEEQKGLFLDKIRESFAKQNELLRTFLGADAPKVN